MSLHILFSVTKDKKLKALNYLSRLSLEPIYQIQEKSLFYLGGFFLKLPEDLPEFLKDYSILEGSVDWEKQWKDFSPHMQGNYLTLDLSPYGVKKTLQLKPGPGFGDLSHPTTSLCLKHMPELCKNHTVIDFGCGSGILSVAAYAFEARKVYSLEIDEASIKHTRKNLCLNGYSTDEVLETLPQLHLEKEALCLINMTFGEQKIALEALDRFPKQITFLSSGILSTQKDLYTQWAKNQGLEMNLLNELQGWAIFKGSN